MPRECNERAVAGARGAPLAGAALAADLLVELDAVAALRRIAALLAPDLADLAEELVAVAPLRGQPTLPTGLGPAHLHLLGHTRSLPLASVVRGRSVAYPSIPRATQPFREIHSTSVTISRGQAWPTRAR